MKTQSQSMAKQTTTAPKYELCRLCKFRNVEVYQNVWTCKLIKSKYGSHSVCCDKFKQL